MDLDEGADEVIFGTSDLVGCHCTIDMYHNTLRYVIKEYDHCNRMLLVMGPVSPWNIDAKGEIDSDHFWIYRREAQIIIP